MAVLSREPHDTAVARLPPTRPLGPLERTRLASEIVSACMQARRELRRVPIDAAVARLRSESPPTRGAGDADTLTEARRLGRAVARTLRLIPGDTRCLARSL